MWIHTHALWLDSRLKIFSSYRIWNWLGTLSVPQRNVKEMSQNWQSNLLTKFNCPHTEHSCAPSAVLCRVQKCRNYSDYEQSHNGCFCCLLFDDCFITSLSGHRSSYVYNNNESDKSTRTHETAAGNAVDYLILIMCSCIRLRISTNFWVRPQAYQNYSIFAFPFDLSWDFT